MDPLADRAAPELRPIRQLRPLPQVGTVEPAAPGSRIVDGASGVADPGEVIRTCPACGGPLTERKCKLLCLRPGCGYFLSCADYY